MRGQFVFPFELVSTGARIVLYGAGTVGKAFYAQIASTGYCEICYWVDQNYESFVMPDIFPKVTSILNVDVSKIECFVVAINEEVQAQSAISYIESVYPSAKVIWRKPDRNTYIDFGDNKIRREKLQMKNLIGYEVKDNLSSAQNQVDIPEKKQIITTGKKKIRFFYAYQQFWNVLRSVAIACQNDDEMDVMFVGCECEGLPANADVRRSQVEKLGIRYIENDHYNIEEDKPDIAIAVCLLSRFAPVIRKYSRTVICIYGSLTKIFGFSIKKTYESMCKEVANLNPDYVLIDNSLYKQMVDAEIRDPRLRSFGNPKFDEIFSAVNDEPAYPNSWSKIKGKKIVLWSTDHHWASPNISFDDYAEVVFKYFKEHQEMACIFRPHRVLILELLRNRVWNNRELEELKLFFDKSTNMIWDDTPTYYSAYQLCDAVLVDMACGMILSTLPLDVPVGGTYRKDGTSFVADDEVAKSIYTIDSDESLFAFLDMVNEEKDPNKEVRREIFDKYIKEFDGKNGERIKVFIDSL